jgi:hypothetical protein
MYFLTLVPTEYNFPYTDSSPRCIGFSEEPFRPDMLTANDTEGGYYSYAVMERFQPGMWGVGEVLAWWWFRNGSWVEISPPGWSTKTVNWAIF